MAIKFLCPLGHRLKVHDDLAGKAGHCPVCRQRVFIPSVSIAPAKPPVDNAELNQVELDAASAVARLSIAASPVAMLASPLALPAVDWLADAAIVATPVEPPPIEASVAPARPTQMSPTQEQPSASLASPEGTDEWDSLSQELGLPPRLSKPAKSDLPCSPATAGVPVHDPLPAFKSSTAKAQPVAKTLAASRTLAPKKTSPAVRPKPAPPPKPARTAAEKPFENLDPLVAALTPQRSPPPRQARLVPARTSSAPPPPTIPRTAGAPFGPPAAASTSTVPAYVPDKAKVHTVYLLAAGMAVVSIFCAVPGLRHLNLAEAPDWARFVLLLSAMQLVYCVWMATLPDWSTVWVGMVVFALVAAVYGMGLAIATATPVDRPVVLDLSDVRGKAQGWCAAVVLLAGLMTYCCGRVSGQWRRSLAPARVASMRRRQPAAV